MKIRSYEKTKRLKRLFYLWRLYRLVNGLLRRSIEKQLQFSIETSPLRDDNKVVLVVTIAFNNDSVLRHQITHMRENWQDAEQEYLVADNSPTLERQQAIQNVCRELNVGYILLPQDLRINKISASYSHGAAATWLYYNYIRVRKPYCFGFMDHDLFPIRKFSMLDKLGSMAYYGFREDRGDAWYLWMGLLFFKTSSIRDYEINFLPCKVNGDVYMDTGGSCWYSLYSRLGDKGCKFPDRIRVPMFVNGKKHRDPVDYIDDCWMHTNNGSNWKNIEDKQDMVKIIWEKYQDVIPDEIHF